MPASVPLRRDFDARHLRKLASRCKDAGRFVFRGRRIGGMVICSKLSGGTAKEPRPACFPSVLNGAGLFGLPLKLDHRAFKVFADLV